MGSERKEEEKELASFNTSTTSLRTQAASRMAADWAKLKQKRASKSAVAPTAASSNSSAPSLNQDLESSPPQNDVAGMSRSSIRSRLQAEPPLNRIRTVYLFETSRFLSSRSSILPRSPSDPRKRSRSDSEQVICTWYVSSCLSSDASLIRSSWKRFDDSFDFAIHLGARQPESTCEV